MLTIGTVASQLGVSPDVLRKWESRHGWPVPLRTGGGTRLYDETQVHLLHAVKRIVESGHSVGEAIALALMDSPLADVRHQSLPHVDRLLELVAAGRFSVLRSELLARRAALDDIVFVESFAAPLMRALGHQWALGHARVWQEHAVSAVMRDVLRQSVAPQSLALGNERVLALLTTPPGERHTLGLSMAGLILRSLNVDCMDLGAETPLDELAAAACACRARIVGLSVSRGYPPRALHAYSEALREALPAGCELWLGGSGACQRRGGEHGIVICTDAAGMQRRLGREWQRMDVQPTAGSEG
ncbi:MerR family transcriptional regulator [Pseudothauera lacus]|uniref:Regulatory protein MerR n=1 Tax=Pseudothauera lacus TaxID=2136175 RepID=A0A2T4IC25_9RHOO|nr:MerR family transcriptional regulator [Pseudothauera lacus]PTD95323.1 hypothetical protein C8261_15000 [Pseudothauera lacus]